jgi:rhodanese-related sulfurtransferase
MGLFDSIKRPAAQPASEAPAAAQPPEEVRVPEVTAGELLLEQRGGCTPLLLDCREDYEWQQLRIPDSVHISMRQIPRRLPELDAHADIVVVCAHGERSYRIAGYLIEQGFCARSLRGGLVEWQARGGPVDNGHRQEA